MHNALRYAERVTSRHHYRGKGKHTKPFDPDEERYYVYRLFDARGALLYIGRSCDPLGRLKAHHASTEWAAQVVQIEGFGPMNWADVIRAERDAIMAERPVHNKDYVTRKTYRAPILVA